MNLDAFIAARQRLLLVGGPGTAKTSRLHAALDAAGYSRITYHAGIAERVDFAGAMVPDLAAGVTRQLPLERLAGVIAAAARGEQVALILDDIGVAPIDVQAAIKSLVTAGGPLSRDACPTLLVCGATNRPGDKAGVVGLCEPLRDEFDCAFGVATPSEPGDQPDGEKPGYTVLRPWRCAGACTSDDCCELSGWCAWAMAAGLPVEVIAWHRLTSGEHLYTWKPAAHPASRFGTYRTWHALGRAWNAGIRDVQSLSGYVGAALAGPFAAYAATASQVPQPDAVRMDPTGCQVPSPTDAGALYLTCAVLARAVGISDIPAWCTYLSRLPRPFQAFLARDMRRKFAADGHENDLLYSREFTAWWHANLDLFAGMVPAPKN